MRGPRIDQAGCSTIGWAACLWPGLPQLWLRGAWSGLLLAAGFSCLLNLLLLTSLVWTELFAPGVRLAAWTAVLVFWSGSALAGRRWIAGQCDGSRPPESEDLFPRALGEYLRGNWFEAEAVCNRLLRGQVRDVEAHLLLATVFRHTGRIEDARRQLNELMKFDGSAKWQWEIAAELERLAEATGKASAVGRPDVAAEPGGMLGAAGGMLGAA
ncbi:MAG: hypothetical protein WD847_20655 [Pirellulales bacterium]